MEANGFVGLWTADSKSQCIVSGVNGPKSSIAGRGLCNGLESSNVIKYKGLFLQLGVTKKCVAIWSVTWTI